MPREHAGRLSLSCMIWRVGVALLWGTAELVGAVSTLNLTLNLLFVRSAPFPTPPPAPANAAYLAIMICTPSLFVLAILGKLPPERASRYRMSDWVFGGIGMVLFFMLGALLVIGIAPVSSMREVPLSRSRLESQAAVWPCGITGTSASVKNRKRGTVGPAVTISKATHPACARSAGWRRSDRFRRAEIPS